MILLDNQTNYEIDINIFKEIANYLNIDRDIELLIVDNNKIQEINYQFRNKNMPTDVLSFPIEDMPKMPLGSIVISIDKAIEVSKKLKHSLDDELRLLFIHGLLHLLGYDHEKDNGQMRQKESKIIKEFNLPDSLIIRGEE